VTSEGLPYRVGIRVGLVHYLDVLQHVYMSVRCSRSQPLHRSVGYGGRILREGNSGGGEPTFTSIAVLRATPYRWLGKYRGMQRSSIAWNQGLCGCVGLNSGFGRLWNVAYGSRIDDRG
jgi:hypothetical protein